MLFTDLVGSTGLSSAVGPVVAEELRREHFALLREAIGESEGEEVKNLGDGLMVTFTSASSAVACGVAMQQRLELRNRSADQQLSIRVGIAHGDADEAEDDWFGPPVVEAARLCAKAESGQILLGELARMMAGARTEHPIAEVGELELKGIPQPVRGFEVKWEALEGTSETLPLPARLRGAPPVRYVGRADDLRRLESLWEAASGGMRQAVMISGDPGIGKTRIATQFAIDLNGKGATVLYGHSDEELGASYGTWIQALSHYVEHAPDFVLDAHIGRHGGELARLVPALRRRRPDTPEPTSSDPDTERHLLISAVVGLLEEACAERPMVLILDDLHWADKPTLALLRRVVADSASFPLLILATYRESDLTREHPLTSALADLHGVAGVERLALRGLAVDDVIAFLEATAGHEMEEVGVALAEEITAETGGNPFFVAELLRHLIESGALAQRSDGRWELQSDLTDLGLPQSVREVIGRRIERLGAGTHKLLGLAAVIGRDFEVGLLLRLADDDEDEVLDCLESAVEASVLVERSEPGRFSFAHALINHTLYEEIGPTRRARMHGRVAAALEELCGDDPGARVAELARHYSAATAPTESAKALGYSIRAGERALAGLAPDEALRWFSQAVELIGELGEIELEVRCDALIGLGEAQRQTGEPAFRETLLGAARIAEELSDPQRMAQAAFANNRGIFSTAGEVDEERIAVLERAFELDGLQNPARSARLLALNALERQFEPDHERRRALAEEALTLARDAGESRTLALVLRDYFNTFFCVDTVERRTEVAEELDALAEGVDDPLIAMAALECAYHIAGETGRMAEAEQSFAQMMALAGRLGQPGLLWSTTWKGACVALARGQLERMESLVERAWELGQAAGEPDAAALYVGHLARLRSEQGRGGELAEMYEQTANQNPGVHLLQAGYAEVLTTIGRRDEAAEIVERQAADRFDSVPRNQLFSATLSRYANAATVLDLAEVAEPLYEILDPWRGLMVWGGISAFGAVDLWLGGLAATLGRHEVADQHFAAATEIHSARTLVFGRDTPRRSGRARGWLAATPKRRALTRAGPRRSQRRAATALSPISPPSCSQPSRPTHRACSGFADEEPCPKSDMCP